MLGRSVSRWLLSSLGVCAVTSACASDFDTSRQIPARGSVGRELYSLVCDRVGAQALREDVTGFSFRNLCHQDAQGHYASKVDESKLVPLKEGARDVQGNVVSMEQQQKNRAYRMARVEALARRREELIDAFDAALPDIDILVKDLGNADPKATCDAPTAKAKRDRMLRQLADTLSRLVDLYNDQTIPMVTRSLGRLMTHARADRDVLDALARIDARQGYRPKEQALGVARPALGYPRFVELVNSVLRLVATNADPHGPKPVPGKASVQFQQMLSVMHEELRTATSDPPLPPLKIGTDAKLDAREVLSRPRGTLEIAQKLLLAQDPAFGLPTPHLIALRDVRAYVSVPLVKGSVPSPFVDFTGPDGKPDGLPDLSPLGEFVTVSGTSVPTPFFSVGSVDGKRDPAGRAMQADGTPMYGYLDAGQTFAASLVKDLRPLVDPDPKTGHETVMKLLAGAPLLFGPRDEKPLDERTYPPDPSRVEAWKASRTDPPPANLGTTPVTLKYRGFHPDASPIVDLVYALGQIVGRPETDDALVLFKKLLVEHPNELARMIGIGLQLKAIADKHPEAKIPANSLLWDEMLDTVVKIAQTPGILEDLFKAFGDARTVKLDKVFGAYTEFKDELSYDKNNLNGPTFNLTTGTVAGLMTPVDRTQPDSGKNKSALQRFMQLLHDANGLAACTKDGAVAHVDIKWSGIPVKLDYPTDPLAKTVCVFLGSSAPSKLPLCGILRIENVAALLLDVALNRATFDVRDDCLNKLTKSPLTDLVGGADAFLEATSGIKGFSTHPTVNGVARMTFFDTAHDGLPGDTTPGLAKTHKFLMDVLDPVPSMVCPEAPFTDKDGKVIHLRKCASFKDTLRGRDNNSLFPLELMDFIGSVQPLAAAFADHGQPLLFVELFDTMHKHWGSSKQTLEECDPKLPKTDSRWCSQDGAVTYEPLLVEFLKTDLFPTLSELVKVVQATKIQHCDVYDATTHTCTKSTERDGVQVLAEAVRALVDPAKVPGLLDRRGNAFAVRNDGTKNPQVTPIYLFIDALKGIDAAFDKWNADHPEDAGRLASWRAARSEIVDQFFAIDGSGTSARFHDAAIPKILPKLIDMQRAQVFAHCPDPKATCTWATTELPKNLSDAVGGPTFAATIDLLEALRNDDATRIELEKLLVYLLDSASDNDAQATTLAASVDLLQVLDDSVNLTPLYRMVSDATSGSVTDASGKVVQRGLVDGSVQLLSRIFAAAHDDSGTEICSKEIDPNHALAVVLERLVRPMTKGLPTTPLEVIMSVIADVNRSDPSSTTKLTGGDYENIAKEISEFCLDKERGLEQVYEVIRVATTPQE